MDRLRYFGFLLKDISRLHLRRDGVGAVTVRGSTVEL